MKFKCTNCVDEGIQKKPCVLKIPKEIKMSDREDWELALRRCPFENTMTDHNGVRFTEVIPLANWKRMK